jgi:UDPglucose 6-dehydrogenase
MFNMPKVGIIGLGFVGDAIRKNCEGVFSVVCIDVDPNKSTGSYQDLQDCEAVFVCVPSPSKPNGECDTSILNSVLYLLKDYKNVIISKTTAVPKFYEKIQTVYPNLVYVPEFLTAANAVRDFACENEIIIGGQVLAYQREAERILKQIQPIKNVGFCSIGEAALVKYIINSFLASKVVFMNEMYELAAAHGYEWNKIRSLIDVDERIGRSHTKVPGPDGNFGFGGMCFPKDTAALIKYADKLNVNLNVLKSVTKKNLTIRLKNSNDNSF